MTSSIGCRRKRLPLYAFVVAGGLFGGITGVLTGYGVAMRIASNWLDQYSIRVLIQTHASHKEAVQILNTILASQYPPCSDQEIEFLREKVFNAEYIADAGRLSGEQIACSSVRGNHPSHPVLLGKKYPASDGTIIYDNIAPFGNSDRKHIGLGKNNAYVVYRSHLPAHLGPIPMRLTSTVRVAAGNENTSFAGAPAPMLSQDSLHSDRSGYQAGVLYATRCSTVSPLCVTSYTEMFLAAHAERSKIFVCTSIGTAIGTLLGFLFSLAYLRNRSQEQQLRRAIHKGKLALVYQPVVDIGTGAIVGVEALVRWTDEDGFQVSPEHFIRLAEERGFVRDITKWVVRQVLREWGETLRCREDLQVNINVSSEDLFDPDFPEFLRASLRGSGVSAQSIGIEITESSTARRDAAIDGIQSLRQSGHSVYIDDFGTGYSSLAYLQDLAIDAIKIDRTFTQAVGTQSVTVSILPQIMAMAETLRLQIVVEGIETAEQASYFSLTEKRILGQGWFYGKPMPCKIIQSLIAQNDTIAV